MGWELVPGSATGWAKEPVPEKEKEKERGSAPG
jgi:hypothetical protein